MPRFAANLTTLWPEISFLDRFAAARRAGFAGVEVLFPYDVAAGSIVDRLAGNDLELVLINAPPPNYVGRSRGFAATTGGSDLFRKDFLRALRHGKVLGAKAMHVMAGVEGDRDTFVANLAWAAAEAKGRQITIEPINREDMPGYFLSDFALAREIVAEVGAPNLGLQFDAYHAQKITGNLLETWEECRTLVRHVQVAGVPGRHEPAGGDVDWPAFFARMDADGYRGWVAGEYRPKGRTEDGLGWMAGGR